MNKQSHPSEICLPRVRLSRLIFLPLLPRLLNYAAISRVVYIVLNAVELHRRFKWLHSNSNVMVLSPETSLTCMSSTRNYTPENIVELKLKLRQERQSQIAALQLHRSSLCSRIFLLMHFAIETTALYLYPNYTLTS